MLSCFNSAWKSNFLEIQFLRYRRTDGQTDRRTDAPSYGFVRTHLNPLPPKFYIFSTSCNSTCMHALSKIVSIGRLTHSYLWWVSSRVLSPSLAKATLSCFIFLLSFSAFLCVEKKLSFPLNHSSLASLLPPPLFFCARPPTLCTMTMESTRRVLGNLLVRSLLRSHCSVVGK